MLILTLLLACGDSTSTKPEADEHAEHAGKPGGEHAEHMGGSEPMGGDHAVHMGGSDHMKQMATTRDALRAKLGDAYDAPVPGLEKADVAAGKGVYEANCLSCHGAAGKGDGEAGKALNPPPGDLSDAFHSRFYSDAGRVNIIREGSPGTAMTAFGGSLSDAQILDVYAYIVTLRAGVPGEHAEHGEHAH